MTEGPSFDELIRRVRAGDQAAATELVRRYEPTIRRAVRYRLTDGRLGSLLDSMDICQSVMASFFVRAASGEYELDTPERLLGLLVAMARNKLASQARRLNGRRREGRRQFVSLDDGGPLVSDVPGPGEEVAGRDLLEEVRRRLSPEERRLMEMRGRGAGWEAIADEVGGGAEALRKKLTRAIDRVAGELGLDDRP